MSTNTKRAKEYEYLYVLNGVILEVMPPLMYRRVGKTELAGRKLIRCPHCAEYLTSIDRSARVRLYRKPGNGNQKDIPGLFHIKCASCKNDVGIVFYTV
jgi:hypothetical protein